MGSQSVEMESRARVLRLIRLESPRSRVGQRYVLKEQDLPFLARMGLIPMVNRHLPLIEAEESVTLRLRAAQVHQTMRAMKTLQVSRMLQDRLRGRGIRSLVYKGVPLSLMTTGTVNGRPPGDIDLLVSPTDVPEAHRLLQAWGWRNKSGDLPNADSDWWWLTQRLTCELTYRGPVASVDLHWRLDPNWRNLSLTFESVWSQRQVVTESGGLLTLSDEHAALLTAVHGTRERWVYWKHIVDWIRQRPQLVDLGAVTDLARRVGAARSLRVANDIANYALDPVQHYARHPAAIARHKVVGGSPEQIRSFGGVAHGTRWRLRTADSASAAMVAATSPLLRRALVLAAGGK